MSQRKSSRAKPRIPIDVPNEPAKSQEGSSQHRLPSTAAVRETIESVIIAFILAFLFRTFEAEAFVIPTGSMAPTLMGRHKDVVCPKCGCPYQVSASEEVEQAGVSRRKLPRVAAGTCPMCRYTMSLLKDPSYSGDRILVDKLSYDLHKLQRWDVIVFKYPGSASLNFIKRLVGLPGETIRIQNGDIWARRPEDKTLGDAGFQIARKSPRKLLAMLQPVFDNDYMPRIAEYGWPARWYADSPKDAATWKAEDDATFRTDGRADGDHWLRYHHRAPSYAQWQQSKMAPSDSVDVRPGWITDFTAYDTGRPEGAFVDPAPERVALGQYWVGDLAFACTVEVESGEGELALELCKGGRQFQCRFDLATGRATLSISGHDMNDWRPTASTALRGKGTHEVMFSNCDDELLLWVDGRVVAFDAPTTYPPLGNTSHKPSDLAPVGVSASGAVVRIGHLRVFRDLFYIALNGGAQGNVHGYPTAHEHADFSLESTPSEPDRFFVLGDNSPKSKDGRLWGREHWVDRDLLIGKAMFIYWPHPWHEIRTPWVHVPFPYFPNFSGMGLVR